MFERIKNLSPAKILLIQIFLCFFLSLFAPCENLSRWTGGKSSYLNTLYRSQDYYRQIAQSCDDLLSQTHKIPNAWVVPGPDNTLPRPRDSKRTKIENWSNPKFQGSYSMDLRGDDKNLPSFLRDLHATTIHIDTNNNSRDHVGIMFGVSRGGYCVAWSHNDYGGGDQPWELSVNGEDGGPIVYSTSNHWHQNPYQNSLKEVKFKNWIFDSLFLILIILWARFTIFLFCLKIKNIYWRWLNFLLASINILALCVVVILSAILSFYR